MTTAKLPPVQIFDGSPSTFVAAAKQFAAESGFLTGIPDLQGNALTGAKQSDRKTGIALFGLRAAPKRPVSENEVWVIAKSDPPIKGAAQTATLSCELKRGEYAGELVAQTQALIAHLSANGWLNDKRR